MRINTNISSLSAQRQLSSIAKAMSQSLARLSSGKRINQAKDDASGLAISTGLTSQIRGYAQIQRSLNDANATLQVADGAIAAQIELVQRMRELAIQSANGTLSDQNRAYLNSEFAQLLEEVDRIAKQTSFQDSVLLDGTKQKVQLQAGTSKGQTIDINFTSTRSDKIFTHTAGTGTFSAAITYALTGPTARTQTADLNGDGINDLITGSGLDLSVRLGVGSGLFSAQQIIDTSTSNRIFSVGDVNGDEITDIVVGKANGITEIYIGKGNGSFNSPQTISNAVGAENIRETELYDINGDGSLDISHTFYNIDTIGIYLNNGNGTFQPAVTYLTEDEPRGHEFADLNNDGKTDMVVANRASTTVSIYLGTGDGRFATARTMTTGGTNPYDPHLVDFNEDGVLDLALGYDSGSGSSIFLGVGNGTFGSEIVTSTSITQFVMPEDFNNDGHIDLGYKSGTNMVVSLGNGDGTFASGLSIDSTQPTIFGFSASDLNNDGVLDLTVGSVDTNNVSILFANTTTASAVDLMSIDTQERAEDVLAFLDTGLENLLATRSTLGAQQNRLEIAINQTATTTENLSMARSQILDTDFANETAELVRNQILEQAGISVLSQANMNLKLALSLLEINLR